jgi:hypothetical protein
MSCSTRGTCHGSCYTGLDTRNSTKIKLTCSSYASLQLRNDAVAFKRQGILCSTSSTVCLSVLTRCDGLEDCSASDIRRNATIMKTTPLGRHDEANLHPWSDRCLSKKLPSDGTLMICIGFTSWVFQTRRFCLSAVPMLTQCYALASSCRQRTHFSQKKYDKISERGQKYPLILTSPSLSLPPSD